jgi:two-component system, NarL family, nitrate/nitrite response regulator NarL
MSTTPCMQIIKVLVADDHPVVRMGLRSVLQSETGLQWLGEAADGEQALALARKLVPDVLILDVNMPKLSGLDVLEILHQEKAPVSCILITTALEREMFLKVFQMGARGVIYKDSAARDIVSAVRSVHEGSYWVAQESIGDLVQALQRSPEKRQRFGLTKRELDIISGIVEGCTNRDIGKKLGISEETVKRHLVNVFDKLGVSSRLELGMFAVAHKLSNETL